MSVYARNGDDLIIGIEEGNIDRLKAGKPYHRSFAEFGINKPGGIYIVYGKTHDDLLKIFAPGIGPDTRIDDRRDKPKQ